MDEIDRRFEKNFAIAAWPSGRDQPGQEHGESITSLQQQALQSPFANSNFLKKAFLESCQKAGVI
jgi:hypothetical protein